LEPTWDVTEGIVLEALDAQAVDAQPAMLAANFDLDLVTGSLRENRRTEGAIVHPRRDGRELVFSASVPASGEHLFDLTIEKEPPKVIDMHSDFREGAATRVALSAPLRESRIIARAVPDHSDRLDWTKLSAPDDLPRL
jgi:hypothetical protein